jgi:hypothetical protein
MDQEREFEIMAACIPPSIPGFRSTALQRLQSKLSVYPESDPTPPVRIKTVRQNAKTKRMAAFPHFFTPPLSLHFTQIRIDPKRLTSQELASPSYNDIGGTFHRQIPRSMDPDGN